VASEMKVYQAIAKVTAMLAKDGISKDRKNEQQGYKFRGIDDVYNALAPFLSEAKLCILPNVLERTVVERVNQKGTALFYVAVKVDFAFVSAEDGSTHHVVTFGEAMDSGDKATNKAMSAAYKYAAMQAFCIPTEGDNDADAQTHEVKAKEADPEALKVLSGAASKGVEAFREAWKGLTKEQRESVPQKTLADLKAKCEEAVPA
jgi:hypothetical protein